MRRVPLLAVVVLVLLAGCVGPLSEWPPTDSMEGGLDDGDGIGVVEGYEANDRLDASGPTLSSRGELQAVTYRAMARVEVLRGQNFEADVDLEVLDRETYREETTWAPEAAGPFTNEAWRAAFVVDGETDYDDALESVYGQSVYGYYQGGEIVLVVPDAETLRIDRETLVHELVHALQDQRGDLTREGETVDERTAEQGLLEGEAAYVAALYDRRCGETWSCLATPDPSDAEGGGSFEDPLFGSVFAPYAEGPSFVAHLHEAGGWDAVDDAFEARPASAEQVLHPETYPDEEPLEVPVTDRSSDAWEPFEVDSADDAEADGDGEGEGGAGDAGGREIPTETMGEATLFASLYAAGVIDRDIGDGGGENGSPPYNYSHPATAGWAGDSLAAYREAGATGDGEATRTGHVWRLAWDSRTDAAQFRDAYVDSLEAHGASPVGADTYRIPDGEAFEGAYHVSLAGDRVTIVGGPTPESLEAIHAPADVRVEPTAIAADVGAGPVASG